MGGIVSGVKRVAMNALLLAGFVLTAAALVISFLADARYAAAEKLVKEYRWAQADAAFRDAIATDPFSSRYPAGLAGFLVMQTGYQAHAGPLFEEAKRLYRKAVGLDPRNAECWLGLGLAEARAKEYDKAFESFRRARENDPHGFNAAYLAGLAGLSAWEHISGTDRAFVIDRLRSAMMARPSIDIYATAWKIRKDMELLRAITPDALDGQRLLYDFIVSRDLWQFRKAQAARVASFVKKTPKKAVSGPGWHGKTPDGNSTYENGAMYWSGTMDAAITLPEGDVTIRIPAKGQPAGGVYPYMIVELDGTEIGEAFVDSAEWKEYEYAVRTTGGIRVLSVTFANDGFVGKEDRNLYVGEARVAE